MTLARQIACALLLAQFTAAEVVVKESVNPATGARTAVLKITGDKTYSDPQYKWKKLPELQIWCYQTPGTDKRPPNAGVVLNTGDEIATKYRTFFDEGFVETTLRFEEDSRPKLWRWDRDANDSSVLRLRAMRGARPLEQLFKSKLLHIEVEILGAAEVRVSSFDLTGLQDEFAKRRECQTAPRGR